MYCKSCGAEIPDDSIKCSQCGNNPHEETTQEVRRVRPEYEFVHAKSRVLAGLLQNISLFFRGGPVLFRLYGYCNTSNFRHFYYGRLWSNLADYRWNHDSDRQRTDRSGQPLDTNSKNSRLLKSAIFVGWLR